MERRGIHVRLKASTAGVRPHVEQFAALERLIGETAPALGLDWVIAEVDGHFQFASHPEAAEPDALAPGQARRLAKMARQAGVRLVPGYNCLGHQSFEGSPGKGNSGKPVALLRSHPEFNEAPELNAAAEADPDLLLSWCPSNAEVYHVVFDLLDELLDSFEADALHVGMDEVLVLGRCPRCTGKSNTELFARAVNDLHGHLVGRRGVEMQMWGDRLLDAATTGYGMWESSENDTHGAIGLIPTDIVICDWHYTRTDEFPSIRHFLDRGFRVWPAGWYTEASTMRLIEAARNEASPRLLGYLATTWFDPVEIVPALAGDTQPAEDSKLAKLVACVRLGARLARA